MYCRHLAWLHAVPEKAKESRQKSLKAANEDSLLLQLPELGEAEYMVPLLYEAGLVEQSGMGITGLSWKELNSWQECTQVKLHTWEVTTLKQMSDAYASEFSQASKPDHPAPYNVVIEEWNEVDRKAVDAQVRNVFRSLMKQQ